MTATHHSPVAIFTGAASGIGRAAASALSAADYRLAPIVATALWRCSPAAASIIGVALPVDGGLTA